MCTKVHELTRKELDQLIQRECVRSFVAMNEMGKMRDLLRSEFPLSKENFEPQIEFDIFGYYSHRSLSSSLHLEISPANYWLSLALSACDHTSICESEIRRNTSGERRQLRNLALSQPKWYENSGFKCRSDCGTDDHQPVEFTVSCDVPRRADFQPANIQNQRPRRRHPFCVCTVNR